MRTVIATRAVLVALAVAVGMILAHIPNVEGMSAVCFFAGYLTDWRSGGLIGGMSMVLLSLLNPLGPAPPPVFAAQVLGMAVVGSAGALLRRLGPAGPRAGIAAMGFGAVLTVLYDALTNYGVAVSVGRWLDPWAIMIAGAPFALLHTVTNTMIFGAVGALLARRYACPRGGTR